MADILIFINIGLIHDMPCNVYEVKIIEYLQQNILQELMKLI